MGRLLCVCFAGIMGGFSWRLLVKQDGPAGRTMALFVVIPAAEVGPTIDVAKVTPGVPSSILAKRKRDNDAWVSGRKKLRAYFSLRTLRQATELMPLLAV